MDDREKANILDNFEYELVRLGFVEASFAIEEFAGLSPDFRWQENARVLKGFEVPSYFAVFKEDSPNWDAAKKAV